MLENLSQDIRYGVRMLLKHPGFTLIAVVALALGIGANSAIFSVVNAVVLRPLAYAEPERLVMVWEKRPRQNRERNPVSPADFFDWRNENKVFEQMAAVDARDFNLTGMDQPERILGSVVSANFFQTLGVAPLLGRAFLPEEDHLGANRVAVLSYGLWQRRFNSDPGIVGKTLALNGESYEVVGVMPARFQFLSSQFELWTPLVFSDAEASARGSHSLAVVARLKPSVKLEQARAEMDTIARRLEQQYQVNAGHYTNVIPLHEAIVGNVRLALYVLLGAVGFVLLIACANVANLLLARAASRQKEIAVRTALGATRTRIVRQLLTESVLLSLVGGALGLLLAMWGVELLVALLPPEAPRASEINLDGRVLGFTFAVSLLTGLVFGLAPALASSKPDLNDALKEGGRTAAGGFKRNRIRGLFVVAEVALALVLLIGAGLLIKSFMRLREVNPGFDPQNVLTMQLSVPKAKYPDNKQIAAFFQETLQRVGNVPGVTEAGAVSSLPLSGSGATRFFAIDGGPPTPPGQGPNAGYDVASPGFFGALKIPLLNGRDFTERDNADAPPVVVINETMARRFWPGEDVIGKRLAIGGQPWRTIVGVVGDVRHSSLDAEPRPQMYFSYLQDTLPFMSLAVRTTTDPASMVAALRSEIHAIDKDQPVFAIKTMNEVLARSVSQRRLYMTLLGIFAGIALLLAAVGIYGVMSYSVTQRTHEIGIRMALGARSSDVLRLVVGQGMTLALVGVVAGLIAALAMTRVIASLLYGVSATDPATFAIVSVVLTTVALLACYIPARRATKVDPMIALRHE